MPETDVCPAPTCRPNDEIHGFRITGVTPVPEIRVTAYEATHAVTGARLLHLHGEDRENWYAVTFRTPPADSTGVAHILEHSVLAGSQRFPVRDAFNELGKGTLRTFLNAFTAPDFTCYPMASQVRADFYNLATVYTDLVFRPLLRKSTFMQEGHHLEIDDDGHLSISGIVYNEMKGAYASADNMTERATLQTLFPDTAYGFESGGDPDRIPDLTYEGFREFHRRYYSASNARIFLYGDIPIADHLAFLSEQLASHSRIEVDSSVPEQRRWESPRSRREEFPVEPDEPLEKKAMVNVAWLTAPMSDSAERLVLEVLAEALVGNAAGPLRKVLIESGLGEDLTTSTGLQSWYRQIPFVVGLRGTEPDRAEEIERLALATLDQLAREGLPRDLLEAAFHQVEYAGRSIPPHRGLIMLFRLMPVWLHDLDPLDPLRFPTLVEDLRRRWEAEPRLFADAARRWLVDNPHRLRLVSAPSRTAAAEFDARVESRLRRLADGMSETDKAEVRQVADALREEQRAAEPPEALATLPRLRIEEIPREAETIPTAERREDGSAIQEHDLFTNGIVYLDLAFDVSDLAEEEHDLLSLFGAVSTEMGAGGQDYAEFATRKALVTGGVGIDLRARERARGGSTLQLLTLRASALRRNVPKMIGVLRDVLLRGDLADTARLHDILSEERNGLRAALVPRGHSYAWRAAASSLSTAAWRDEQWHGVTQLRRLNRLFKQFEAEVEPLRGRLAALRSRVFRRGRLNVNLTGDAESLRATKEPLADLFAALPAGGEAAGAREATAPVRRRGVGVSGKVCYVARVMRVPKYVEPGAPELMTLANHLSDGVLYKKIRVEGGAYGGSAQYNPNLGHLAFLSYRDPNLEKTVEVYDRCLEMFLEEPLDDDTVRKTVIGTVADLDRPMNPATKGYVAFDRRIAGITDEDRQRFRDAVLAIDAAALRRAAVEILRPAMAEARQAVLASKERIEAANATLAQGFQIEALE